jgi:hypothetical protein
MVSVTTNFTLEELKHINVFFWAETECEVCIAAKKKIVDAIELAEIAERARGIQEESIR